MILRRFFSACQNFLVESAPLLLKTMLCACGKINHYPSYCICVDRFEMCDLTLASVYKLIIVGGGGSHYI